MENKTIKLADAKKLAFGIEDLKIFKCMDLLWIVTMRFADERYGYGLQTIGLETFRGELRLFKTADAAIKAAKEIGFDGRIWVDWADDL